MSKVIHHHHVYHFYASDNGPQLTAIFSLLNQIKMTQTEALDKVNALTAQVTKIGTEVSAVKDALAAAQAANQAVPEALAEAINNLSTVVTTVDDLNADAPAAPETQL